MVQNQSSGVQSKFESYNTGLDVHHWRPLYLTKRKALQMLFWCSYKIFPPTAPPLAIPMTTGTSHPPTFPPLRNTIIHYICKLTYIHVYIHLSSTVNIARTYTSPWCTVRCTSFNCPTRTPSIASVLKFKFLHKFHQIAPFIMTRQVRSGEMVNQLFPEYRTIPFASSDALYIIYNTLSKKYYFK